MTRVCFTMRDEVHTQHFTASFFVLSPSRMVASARCFGFVLLALFALGAGGASTCPEGNNVVDYGNRCIHVARWYPSTMKEAAAACWNISGGMHLPQLNSSSDAKWDAVITGIRKLSMTKAVFWIGLERKGGMWKWQVDGSIESGSMWNNGRMNDVEQSKSKDCVLGWWDREQNAWGWIKSPCQNGSKVVSVLVCECIKDGWKQGGPNPDGSTDSPAASEPWNTYGRWILLGVVLAVITVLIIIGTVLYVRRRRQRIERRQLMSRRDPPSVSNRDSISVKDDTLRALFHISESDVSQKEKKDQKPKKSDTSNDGIAVAGAEQRKHGSQGSTGTDDNTPESETAASDSRWRSSDTDDGLAISV